MVDAAKFQTLILMGVAGSGKSTLAQHCAGALGWTYLEGDDFHSDAGKQMMEAKQYGLCLVACVMVLIPGVSPCCVIGLFFGITGITRLNDPRVKRGFAANRPGFDPDAAG